MFGNSKLVIVNYLINNWFIEYVYAGVYMMLLTIVRRPHGIARSRDSSTIVVIKRVI